MVLLVNGAAQFKMVEFFRRSQVWVDVIEAGNRTMTQRKQTSRKRI